MLVEKQQNNYDRAIKQHPDVLVANVWASMHPLILAINKQFTFI